VRYFYELTLYWPESFKFKVWCKMHKLWKVSTCWGNWKTHCALLESDKWSMSKSFMQFINLNWLLNLKVDIDTQGWSVHQWFSFGRINTFDFERVLWRITFFMRIWLKIVWIMWSINLKTRIFDAYTLGFH